MNGLGKYIVPILGGLALSGCGPGFDPKSLITDLRILTVQAEPPEVKPGEETTYRALVAAPLGYADPLVYTYVQCTIGDSGCIEQEEALANADGDQEAADVAYQKTSVRYGLTFVNEGTANPLGANIQTASTILGGSGEAGDLGSGEANAQVSLLVCPASECAEGLDTEGGGEGAFGGSEGSALVAIKRARVSLKETPNQNPVVTGIEAIYEGGEAPTSLAAPGETLSLLPGATVTFNLILPGSSAEPYLFETDDGVVEERVERLYVGWYGGAGRFEFNSTDTYIDDATGEVKSMSPFEVPETLEDGQTEFPIHAVVYDRRGGIGWITIMAQI